MGTRWYTRDWVLIPALGGLLVLGALNATPGRRAQDIWGLLLLVGSLAVLPARRRAPAPVLVVTVAALVGYLDAGYPGLTLAVPVLIAIYAAVDAGRRVFTAVTAGSGLVAVIVADAIAAGPHAANVAEPRILLAGWMVAAAVLAEVSRQRRATLAQALARAAEAEHTREETARRRAGEERLRIARELHDALTHSISLIKVQAGVAVHLARKRDEPVCEALVAIQEASAEAMRELRATLEVLRRDADDPPGTGLDRLTDLVDRARGSGLPATVSVTGARRDLPVLVDRTAYRIVQEALTNIARHAGRATARIHLGYGDDALTVRVDDDGPPAAGPAGPPGVGLLGMRERVAALGGSLQAGPRPAGGFRVHAELPLDPA